MIEWSFNFVLLLIVNVILIMLEAGGILSVILPGWWYCPVLLNQRFLEEVGSEVI